jgi:hypothetical protein
MAEEHRQEMERENRKLSATDLARLQERVRCLHCWICAPVLTCSPWGDNPVLLQDETRKPKGQLCIARCYVGLENEGI